MFGIEIGILMLLGYFILVFGSALIFTTKSKTKEHFLVADREIGEWKGAFSVAATWIWAPALFIAAQKAYTQGWVGLFWFTVPNVFCLIFFAKFAEKLRNRFPKGYTLSDYMKKRYSKRVHTMYMTELSALSIFSIAVQLLAGGKVISLLTGLPFNIVTLVLAGIALSYSLYSGIKSSIFTDYFQMIFIGVVAFTFVPWAIHNSGGFTNVINGLNGLSGDFTSLFTGKGGNVFLTFGLATTIGLMAGPFGDQSFWQRAFSIKKGKVRGAFVKGAWIFATVPILMSLLGFAMAGLGIEVKDASLVNLDMIIKFLPVWTIIPFTYMLLSGLISTVDSCLCSMSSLMSDYSSKKVNRGSMVISILIGVIIANIPGIQILYLFLLYGTLRASTFLPTVISLSKENVSEKAMFWGILSSIIIGLPVFAYGKFSGNITLIVGGSLLTMLISGMSVLLVKRKV